MKMRIRMHTREILAMGFVVIRLTFAVNTYVLIEDMFSPDLLGFPNKNIINVAMQYFRSCMKWLLNLRAIPVILFH